MKRSKKTIACLLTVSLIACTFPTSSSAAIDFAKVGRLLKSRYAAGIAGLALMIGSRLLSFDASEIRNAGGIDSTSFNLFEGESPQIARIMRSSMLIHWIGQAILWISLKEGGLGAITTLGALGILTALFVI